MDATFNQQQDVKIEPGKAGWEVRRLPRRYAKTRVSVQEFQDHTSGVENYYSLVYHLELKNYVGPDWVRAIDGAPWRQRDKVSIAESNSK